MNQIRNGNGGGRNVPARSGALSEPRSVSLLNANRRMDIQRSEGESWMMVYLDVITLLLVAFLLVIANMNRDVEPEQKIESGQASVQPVPPREVDQVAPSPARFEELHQDSLLDAPDSVLQNQLMETLRSTEGLEDLEISMEAGTVNLNLPEKILFETGQAELIGRAGGVLKKIVPVLIEYSAPVSVEGHTDDVPIRTARFPSNWELSSARATEVLRFLIANGVAPNLLRAVGYADTRPVASNTSWEGRSNNRRVNLVIHMNRK